MITSTHRGHGHVIAKGADVRRMMAELLGRVDGLNRGRGGSMHVADLGVGIYGANGIVARRRAVRRRRGVGRRGATGRTASRSTFFGDGGATRACCTRR